MPERYRPNVAAILQKPGGEILICQRTDYPDCWQFPQGGIDGDETALQALHRELEEETGLNPTHYEVITSREGYRYDFPDDNPLKKGFTGQQQTYFLCLFNGQDSDINLNTHHPEFADYRWIKPDDFQADWLPEFKREAVLQALADLLGRL